MAGSLSNLSLEELGEGGGDHFNRLLNEEPNDHHASAVSIPRTEVVETSDDDGPPPPTRRRRRPVERARAPRLLPSVLEPNQYPFMHQSAASPKPIPPTPRLSASTPQPAARQGADVGRPRRKQARPTRSCRPPFPGGRLVPVPETPRPVVLRPLPRILLPHPTEVGEEEEERIARDSAFAGSVATRNVGDPSASTSDAGPSTRPPSTIPRNSESPSLPTTQTEAGPAIHPAVCGICFDDTPVASQFAPAACRHSFCEECMRQHLSIVATDTSQYPTPCPGCQGSQKRTLNPQACLVTLAGTGTPHESFERLMIEDEHAQRLCYCPNEKCSTPFDFQESPGSAGEAEAPMATCPVCGTNTCVNCKVRWHTGRDCVQFKSENDGSKLLAKLEEEKKWKACPRCKVTIEKTEGCNHMRCRCGLDFCYKCGNEQCSWRHRDTNLPVAQPTIHRRSIRRPFFLR